MEPQVVRLTARLAAAEVTVGLNTAHSTNTSNPHAVTAAQAGAEVAGAVAAHEGTYDHTALHTQGTDTGLDTGGPNAVTAATITAHHANTTNPHAVTAAQAGADPAGTAAAEVATHDVANNHVDHSAVQVATSATSGLSGGGDLTATRNLALDVSQLTAAASVDMALDRFAFFENSSGTTKKVAPAKIINDAGSGSSDIWSGSKITTELATKADTGHTHAAADVTSGTFADARITASNVTQHQASINHNSLSNYVADQHVAHSGVSISTPAASGLSGGGTIAATRSLALDINGMTLGFAVDTVNDRVALYDDDVAAHRKVSVNLLISALDASNLVSGTVPDARVSESSVTQHAEAVASDGEISGSSFPSTAGRTAPFFHTTFREWFSWDSSNSVWLGETLHHYSFGEAAASNNVYLKKEGATTSAQSRGILVHFDIAIVRITATCNTTLSTGNIRVRRSNSATNIASLDVSTGAGKTFDSGDIYATFNKADGTNFDGGMTVFLDSLDTSSAHTHVNVWFRRRET